MTAMSTTHRSLIRVAILLAVFAIVATACSSNDSTTTTTAATTIAPTTTAPTTSTPAPTVAPTTAAPTTTAPTTTNPPDTNSLASGSGCTPGTDDTLPDGEWFGYVTAAVADKVDFDLACWFTGDAAARAAAEDGEESPPPNDYYVRNVNTSIRTLAVDGGAGATWLPNPGDPSTEATGSYDDWLAGRATRDYQPGVWLTVSEGAIVTVREQYVP